MVSILDPQSIYLSVRGYALQIRANEILKGYNIRICFNSLVTLYNLTPKGKAKPWATISSFIVISQFQIKTRQYPCIHLPITPRDLQVYLKVRTPSLRLSQITQPKFDAITGNLIAPKRTKITAFFTGRLWQDGSRKLMEKLFSHQRGRCPSIALTSWMHHLSNTL